MKRIVAALCILSLAGMPGCASYTATGGAPSLQKQIAEANARMAQLNLRKQQPDYSATNRHGVSDANTHSRRSGAATVADTGYPDEMYGADYSSNYAHGREELKRQEEQEARENEFWREVRREQEAYKAAQAAAYARNPSCHERCKAEYYTCYSRCGSGNDDCSWACSTAEYHCKNSCN